MEPTSFMNTMRERVRSGISTASKTAQRYSRIGRLRAEEQLKKHMLNKEWTEMGKRIYALLKENRGSEAQDDPILTSSRQKIDEQLKQLDDLKSQLCEEQKAGTEGIQQSPEQSVPPHEHVAPTHEHVP
ncbi:MAG: hypothetical protein GF401_09415 [Chitinivibrionales bacterium]|nr:hypothetical protein [Chitinivibrionales bacterium]